MNKFAQSFWRHWRPPCVGCAFGFLAGSAFSISIISLKRISLLHASSAVYEQLKAIEDRISIPGEIIMRLVNFIPPYPDGGIPWSSVAFVVFSNATVLAIFGLVIGWLHCKHHRALQTARSSGTLSHSPTLVKDQHPETSARGYWAVTRKGVFLGATTGILLTVGSYALLSLSTGDSLLAWVTAPGLVVFEPARFLAFKLGWSVSAYPVTWALLLWGTLVNSIAFIFIGVVSERLIRAFYRITTFK